MTIFPSRPESDSTVPTRCLKGMARRRRQSLPPPGWISAERTGSPSFHLEAAFWLASCAFERSRDPRRTSCICEGASPSPPIFVPPTIPIFTLSPAASDLSVSVPATLRRRMIHAVLLDHEVGTTLMRYRSFSCAGRTVSAPRSCPHLPSVSPGSGSASCRVHTIRHRSRSVPVCP